MFVCLSRLNWTHKPTLAKNSILKWEGIQEKIFYERHVYESVKDRSPSQAISQRLTEELFRLLRFNKKIKA